MASAATSQLAAANSIIQIGSPGNSAFMIVPIAVATSSCGTTMKTLKRAPIHAG